MIDTGTQWHLLPLSTPIAGLRCEGGTRAHQEKVSSLPLQKGGSGKGARDYSLIDAIVYMAEAHACVAQQAIALTGIPEEALNESIRPLSVFSVTVSEGITPPTSVPE